MGTSYGCGVDWSWRREGIELDLAILCGGVVGRRVLFTTIFVNEVQGEVGGVAAGDVVGSEAI